MKSNEMHRKKKGSSGHKGTMGHGSHSGNHKGTMGTGKSGKGSKGAMGKGQGTGKGY